MKKLTSLFRTLFIISLHVVALPVLAQDPGFPFENDPGNDPAAAPIDQWILPAVVVITLLMVLYFRKQHKHQTH